MINLLKKGEIIRMTVNNSEMEKYKFEAEERWGKTNSYVNPIALGQYGPIDADEYKETTVDDLRKLFGEDQNLVNIYLAWVMLVAEKMQEDKLTEKHI